MNKYVLLLVLACFLMGQPLYAKGLRISCKKAFQNSFLVREAYQRAALIKVCESLNSKYWHFVNKRGGPFNIGWGKYYPNWAEVVLKSRNSTEYWNRTKKIMSSFNKQTGVVVYFKEYIDLLKFAQAAELLGTEIKIKDQKTQEYVNVPIYAAYLGTGRFKGK